MIDRLNAFVLLVCMFGRLQRQVAKQNFVVIIGHTLKPFLKFHYNRLLNKDYYNWHSKILNLELNLTLTNQIQPESIQNLLNLICAIYFQFASRFKILDLTPQQSSYLSKSINKPSGSKRDCCHHHVANHHLVELIKQKMIIIQILHLSNIC